VAKRMKKSRERTANRRQRRASPAKPHGNGGHSVLRVPPLLLRAPGPRGSHPLFVWRGSASVGSSWATVTFPNRGGRAWLGGGMPTGNAVGCIGCVAGEDVQLQQRCDSARQPRCQAEEQQDETNRRADDGMRVFVFVIGLSLRL
jgi:hypothetical protein